MKSRRGASGKTYSAIIDFGRNKIILRELSVTAIDFDKRYILDSDAGGFSAIEKLDGKLYKINVCARRDDIPKIEKEIERKEITVEEAEQEIADFFQGRRDGVY